MFSKFALCLTIFFPIFWPFQDGKYDPTTLVFPTFLHTYGVRKATKFHLFLFVQNRVKVKNPQGIASTRLNSWDDPSTEKDDDELTVYGVNSGENVIIYNTSMTSIGIYGLNERGTRKLNAPKGITASPWGDVYLADTGNNRVVHFFNPGRRLQFKGELRADGLQNPEGVALTEDSTLYVTDTGHSRLLLLRGDTLNSVIAHAGKMDGQVWQPTGVAATSAKDAWSYYRDDFVIVIDSEGKRVQKFLRDGTFIKAIRADDFGYANAELKYATIDYYSQIWITDKANHCIHKFDRQLNYLDSFGRKGTGSKEFVEPRGISIYKRFGQMLIAEKEAAQYYWVGTDVKNLQAQKDEKGFLTVTYFLTEPSFVTLEIFNSRKKKIGQPLKKIRRPAGENIERFTGDWQVVPYVVRNKKRIYLDDRIGGLLKVKKGSYRLKFVFSATYSSYKYFQKKMERMVTF